jgi:DNA-binding NarL/FixJ family response regulator
LKVSTAPGGIAAENDMIPPLQANLRPGPDDPARVFIVEDHAVLASILADILEQSGLFKVIGTAGDGTTALAAIQASDCDLLIVDLVLPGLSGIEFLRHVRDLRLRARTVVYSGIATREAIATAFDLGVSAFIEKRVPLEELLRNLQDVLQGQVPLNERTSEVLRAVVRERTGQKRLSSGDLAVLRHLAERQNPKEIAALLGISPSAVYKAKARIVDRLGLSGPDRFAEVARRLGLTTPELATATA